MKKNIAIIAEQAKTLKTIELLLDKIGLDLDKCCDLMDTDFDWNQQPNNNDDIYDPKIRKPIFQLRQLQRVSIDLRTEYKIRKNLEQSKYPEYPYKTIERGYMVLYNDEVIENLWFPKAEHRFVVEEHIGRRLTRAEIIHHIDGNKMNNDIKNLQIMTNSEHAKLHRTKSKKC